jgi:hypothetical protein
MKHNQLTLSNQQLTSNLTNTVKELNTSLQAIKPDNSETVQIITYTLLATAIVGIFVYQYIKSQDT